MATDQQLDGRVVRLAEGFNALMDEYNQLLARSQTLEKSLLDAKSQPLRQPWKTFKLTLILSYEFLSTKQISLQRGLTDFNQFQHFVSERGTVSAADVKELEISEVPRDIENPLRRSSGRWWMRTDLPMNKKNLLRARYAVDAVQSLNLERASTEDARSKISSEVMINGGSSAMPSILESPLEQDFTIAGTPSRLDCPFASMTNRRLSAHAASVVSKYNKPNGIMTPRSAASRASARSPVPKASDAPGSTTSQELPISVPSPAKPSSDIEATAQTPGAVCPIRFLEKKPPEEIAEYFEQHKHELPRSHEVCVRRFGRSEAGVRQLDAKYGNLVSMIQGLGQKHAPMLPGKEEETDEVMDDEESTDRVRQWADDISNVAQAEESTQVEEQERVSHFDRPMKDVRVGESPSRPWGIQVPIAALEKAENQNKTSPAEALPNGVQKQQADATTTAKPARGCPFAHGAPPGMVNPHLAEKPEKQQPARATSPNRFADLPHESAVFISGTGGLKKATAGAGMTFSGPVFIGYDPEQAASVLRALQNKGL